MAESGVLKAFVTGWPIGHSRSPLIHDHWLREHGVDGSYERVPVEPDDFPAFIDGLVEAGYRGGNVTLPHKQTAFDLLPDIDDEASAIGAVNTIWLKDGQLHGANTDAYGFLANLDEQAPGWDNETARNKGALVVGAGGAARAIVHALKQRRFATIHIANRSLERAQDLANGFGRSCRAIPLTAPTQESYDCALLVNTSSVGMTVDRLPLDIERLSADCVVTDIVYTPLTTPLLKDASDRGLHTVDGLGMLLHQAVPGFEHWFGVRPEVTSRLRNLILQDLGERP